MMTARRHALALAFGMAGLALHGGAEAQGQAPPPEEAGEPPITLSLAEAVQMSLKNNLDIRIAEKTPLVREQDVISQEAVFDPNLGFSALYQDNSRPSSNVFDVGAPGALASVDSEVQVYTAGYSDRLRWGGSYAADLNLTQFSTTSANAVFPTIYQTSFEVAYNQSLLRNFGKKANETEIVVAQNTHGISRSDFRQEVLDALKAVEDAYWDLVFARQDLDVKKDSLRLAQELLRLNQVKVQVGTLPPIEITQAEAEVANREQGVIVAENAIRDAEDVLRRVLNMPKEAGYWERPLVPSDEPVYVERPVDLPREMETALSRRPDLEKARLEIDNAGSRLAFDKNQLLWDLNFRATYTLAGLGGDLVENQNFSEPLDQMSRFDFPSWSVAAVLGVPLGNRSAGASYSKSRLEKEQADIRYENARLNAEVELRTAARAIATNKKRIDAAEKNVELQRKKVDAEQKKFENGMSTSFQVLEFQEDLTTALGDKNRALVDYRKSLTALEQAKGTLDEYLKVSVQ